VERATSISKGGVTYGPLAGGAIALGHPIGCSGARVLTTLIYALRDRDLKTGVASACLGGGEAVAMGIEVI